MVKHHGFNGQSSIYSAAGSWNLTAKGLHAARRKARLYRRPGPSPRFVYRRRQHVINLFVTPRSRLRKVTRRSCRQCRRIQHSTLGLHRVLEFFAISDINGEELQEFVEKNSAIRPKGA